MVIVRRKRLYTSSFKLGVDLSMRRAKKYKDYFEDIKPVTDEELEELLNDPPRRRRSRREFKKAKKDLYREF